MKLREVCNFCMNQSHHQNCERKHWCTYFKPIPPEQRPKLEPIPTFKQRLFGLLR
jgi:hypothetical protein